MSRRFARTAVARAGGPPHAAAAALTAWDPSLLVLALVAAACVVVSASYVLYDTDLWSLLVGGKSIWTLGRIPREDLWTWRHYGEPQTLSSWAFRALLWPLWSAGGVAALAAWRWASAVATFALLWATARAMGSRGRTALVVLVWCALVYRLRTDIRPETMAAPLLALVLWLLETRRHTDRATARDRDRAWWIVPVACVWANTHISYWLGFLLIGIYLVDAHVAAWRARRAGARGGTARPATLWLVALAAAAASFVNPYGWRPLAQPFEFALFWRGDPMFRAIGELHPPVWSANLRNGLPLLMLGWPLLIAWRAARRGPDVAETLACAAFSTLALTSQRFIGVYAMVAAPFVARDLAALAAGRPARPRHAAARTALAAALCVAISIPEWLRPELPLGIGIAPRSVPARACDFMAAHGVRGRGFNDLHLGGYLAWRFWPERDRLPFMDTQPEHATAEDRRLAIASLGDAAAWAELDRRHRFDYVFIDRDQTTGSLLPDILDRDTTWALVFTDDAAQLFVRHPGPLAALADTFGYRVLPAGQILRGRLPDRAAADPAFRRRAIEELARAAASSPANASAHHLLGILALIEDRAADARRHLEAALALEPRLPRVHQMLAWAAIAEGRPADALAELGRERRLHGEQPGLDFERGRALQQLGDLGGARQAYRRELARDPGHGPARDSLARLGG